MQPIGRADHVRPVEAADRRPRRHRAGADDQFAVVAKVLTRIPKVGQILAPIAIPALAEAVKLGNSKLEEVHAQALANRDFLRAVVTQFRLDLDHGVDDHLFVKSLW